jgi:hypothetical protein
MHRSGPIAPVFTLEGLESSLAERYHAVAHWNIPKHPGFNTYEARLQSFDCGWPHERPDPRLLSAAGFYTGTATLLFTLATYTRISSYVSFTLSVLLQIMAIKPSASTVVVVSVVGHVGMTHSVNIIFGTQTVALSNMCRAETSSHLSADAHAP